jgi:hypothetical protein
MHLSRRDGIAATGIVILGAVYLVAEDATRTKVGVAGLFCVIWWALAKLDEVRGRRSAQ